MRTTLTLDDVVERTARAIAQEQRISLGEAVSMLARRGMQAQAPIIESGFPVLDIPRPGHIITDEIVREHRDDDYA
jgi:hypothetical protein